MLFFDALFAIFLDAVSSYLAFLFTYSSSKSFIVNCQMKADPLTKKKKKKRLKTHTPPTRKKKKKRKVEKEKKKFSFF